MNKSVGTYLAASVAALFAAACDQSTKGSPEPASTGTTTSGTAAPGASAEGAGTPAAAPAMPDPNKPGMVQCLGIHECKGKSACHVIGAHACAGQNSCKGKGWIHVPRAECEAKGGKVLG